MLLFRYFKVFKVHIADGYGITAQIHYELTVAQDAHDVTFLSFQHTSKYAQFDVVFGKFLMVFSAQRQNVSAELFLYQ